MSDDVTDIVDTREQMAKALSVPQHHTSWPLLSFHEKDLYYMQADVAIALMEADLATLRKQLENAREALRQWEEWETKWLVDARCWTTDDGSHIPQDLFDEYVCGPQNAREALKGHP